MSLKSSYTLLAPLYDAVIARPSAPARRRILGQLPQEGGLDILINGIGTGLDLPFLPPAHRYVGLDLTRAMLARAAPKGKHLRLALVQGSSLSLPFSGDCFDHAVLHLILAVVPEPARCLQEAARVVKPGGRIWVFDKFLRPGQRAWLRRALNPLARRVATRLDVVFEEVLRDCPQLQLESDMPLLAGGWFRAIRLVKR